jgi:predicted phage terminase large subunit-like protein
MLANQQLFNSKKIDLTLLSVFLSPADLGMYVSDGKWDFVKHLQLFNDAVIDLANDNSKGLIICMPPRHGKSIFGSYYVPAWWIGKFKDSKVILTSYEANFAARWGRLVRDLLKEYGQMLFGISISSNSKAAHRWDVENGEGGMNTAGAGGAITGKGANLFVIDDPIKNSEEANSETVRNKIWEWYLSTVETRLEPKGKQLIIQTRWHEDDLAGRLIKEINEGKRRKWKVLSFPALCETKDIVKTVNGVRYRVKQRDILGRSENEALWPERYSTEYLLDLKNRWDHDEAKLGPYWFSALYQQNPTPLEGEVFKRSWLKYFYIKEGEREIRFQKDQKNTIPFVRLSIVISVDLATSLKETSDFTVFSCWGYDRADTKYLFLLDVIRERMSGADHEEVLKQFCLKHNPHVVLIEAIQYQQALAQTAIRAGLPVFEVRPKGDKLARALSFASFLKAGQVFFPAKVSWVNPLINELATFPQGAHDDFVDTCSMMSNHMVMTNVASICY